MSYVKVEHDNFFGRMGKSLVGSCVGLLLFLVSFAVLAWNENNIRTSALALREAQDALEAGRAGYITGQVDGCHALADGTFGIRADLPGLLALKRDSEQYQVVEHSRSRKQKTIGGGETRVTEYSYSREWRDRVVDSSSFEDNSYRNANPNEFAAAAETRWCSDVSLAGVSLPRQAIEELASASWTRLDVHDPEVSAIAAIGAPADAAGGSDHDNDGNDTDDGGNDSNGEDDVSAAAKDEIRRANRKNREERRGNRADGRDRRAARERQRASRAAGKRALAVSSASRSLVGYTLHDNAVYSGDPYSPKVGDERYRFHAAAAPEASAVGVITTAGSGSGGRVLKPIRTRHGREILLTGVGQQDASQLFESAHNANATMGWLLRGLGWLMMFGGLLMVFGPISVAPQAVPLIGGLVSSIIGGGLWIAALVLSLSLSIITIAITWFAVRPALTVTIVVGVLGALYVLRGLRNKGSAAAAAAAAASAQPAAAASASAAPADHAADAQTLQANRKPAAPAAAAASE